MKTNKLSKNIINICLILLFVYTLFYPIVSMLSRITIDNFVSIVQSNQFIQACSNSLFTGLVATLITLILSFIAAWCLERVDIKFKGLLSIIFIIPMLIPSISHAFGLVALFGKSGFITKILNIDINIYGTLGIIVGSIMYAFPVSFLMFSNILHYEDGNQYKATEVLGIPRIRTFIDITLPYLKKTIISAFFAVFTMVVTDYGVPLMIGGKTITLSTFMYNKAVGMLDYGSGSVIGLFLLIPAVIAFIVDINNKENSTNGFVNSNVKNDDRKLSKVFAYIFCLIVTICVFAPIASFLIMVFETKYPIDPTFTIKHIVSTINKGASNYLINSLLYAVLTSIVGTIIAFTCAYMSTRIKGKLSSVTHFISILSMAIPGIVLGLSYVISFHGQIFYGTILIIIIINTIHFFSSPYLMIYNSLNKINPDLESVGLCLGVSKIRIIIDVILPKIKHTLLDMATYFFVNSMMTISAVSFLAPPSPKPIALMINQFESQLLMESVAFVSLTILIVNILLKIITNLINID